MLKPYSHKRRDAWHGTGKTSHLIEPSGFFRVAGAPAICAEGHNRSVLVPPGKKKANAIATPIRKAIYLWIHKGLLRGAVSKRLSCVRLTKNAKLYARSKVSLFHGSSMFLQSLWGLLVFNAAPRKNKEKQPYCDPKALSNSWARRFYIDQACAVGLRFCRDYSIRIDSDRPSGLSHAFDFIGLGFMIRRVRHCAAKANSVIGQAGIIRDG